MTTTATDDLLPYLDIFLAEAAEHLATLEGSLLELEHRPDDLDLLDRLFRAAHSIKGGAATFGMVDTTRLTHQLESVLGAMRDGSLGVTRPVVDLMLRSADALHAMLAARGGAIDAPVIDDLLAELEATLGDVTSPADRGAPVATPDTLRIGFAPPREALRDGLDPLILLRELVTLGRVVEVQLDTSRLPALRLLDVEACVLSWDLTLETGVPAARLRDVFEFSGATLDITELAPPPPPPAIAPPVRARPSTIAPHLEPASIRVTTEKVDDLMNLVGELVIGQSMVTELTRGFTADKLERLVEAVAAMERNTRELQARVLSIRMIPIGTVFSRFPRMVRDLAASLGKHVELQLEGDDTELDRNVVERIVDPLTHLVRNAIDHGIERPDERVAAGKPASGTVRLVASHQGGNVVVEVCEDGRGLDTARIHARAVALGLLDADAAPTVADVHALIFTPGFSTASEVTSVSGRGVGMDVVKRNIEALSGSVTIQRQATTGTCFRITLPLTLAILDGLCCRVGTTTYVLPLTAIVEVLRVSAAQLKRVLGQGELLLLRDETIPLERLHQRFGIADSVLDPTLGLVIVVEHQGRKLGLLVDEITGQAQVVIKSLETNYHRIDGLMGATILGNGQVALILDVQGVVRAHDGARTSRPSVEPRQGAQA